jgi:hypothetical protein
MLSIVQSKKNRERRRRGKRRQVRADLEIGTFNHGLVTVQELSPEARAIIMRVMARRRQ